jgi:hypothetical protein
MDVSRSNSRKKVPRRVSKKQAVKFRAGDCIHSLRQHRRNGSFCICPRVITVSVGMAETSRMRIWRMSGLRTR